MSSAAAAGGAASTAAASSAGAAATPAPSSSAAGSASSAAAASGPPAADVDALLRELAALERTTEVTRVISAFKYNPLDILNVHHAAGKDEINKAYRASSLQVHPDKFTAGAQRDRAQQAFTMLAAAKDELLDAEKREKLDELVDQARQRVLTARSAESRKKRKLASGAGATAASDDASAEEEDPSKDPLYDSWIRAELKEIFIEREWRKRQLLKAAAVEDTLAAEAKAKRAADKEARDSETKAWEDGRDTRINSWRNFQTKGLKGKGAANKLKMPKLHAEDSTSTYIKRPVAHQSSEM